jgi:pilus assembly protein CpaC
MGQREAKSLTQLLADKGAAEIKSNPKLVTCDGREVSLHLGGEFPYVTTSGLGNIKVEYKQYGTHIYVVPKLQASKQFRMSIRVEQSELDNTKKVEGGAGNPPPGLTMKSLNAKVNLKAGQTAIVSGFGDPQLVCMVTAHLVSDVTDSPAAPRNESTVDGDSQ